MDDPIFPESEYLQSSQEITLERIFRHLIQIASLRISNSSREREKIQIFYSIVRMMPLLLRSLEFQNIESLDTHPPRHGQEKIFVIGPVSALLRLPFL
jgi:hypothetical protein